MLFKNINILDENFEVKKNMFVGTKEDKIAYIGTEEPKEDFGEVYDGTGKLLMSGFYNTHTHQPMSVLRGYGGGLNLQDWLNQKIFPFEAHLDEHDVYWGTVLATAEAYATGIVSSTDMYSTSLAEAQAVADTKAKMNIGRGSMHFDDSDYRLSERYQETLDLYNEWHGKENGRILTDASIHGEYTSNPQCVTSVLEFAKERNLRMHIHLSETKLEHEESKERRNGMTPAQYFNSLGLFDVPTTAAHCVWLEGEDFDILRDKGVTVAHNPVSNRKLASGAAQVMKMREMGIRVTIGTDGVSSNNSLNFFEEMKFASLGSKLREMDPMALEPYDVVKMATYDGAQSQGRTDCGLIKEGNKADMIVVSFNAPHMFPVHDMIQNIVFSANPSDVVLTMVDGTVVYRNGDFLTLDIEKTKYEAQKTIDRILGVING